MLDALTQRLSSVVKTLRGHSRITDENVKWFTAGLPDVPSRVVPCRQRAVQLINTRL